MWPFDLDKENSILKNRVHDLGRTVEILTGANQILTQELESTKQRESVLLNKIFEVTGLTKSNNKIESSIVRQPVPLSNRGVSWPKLQESLETQARKSYWEKKQSQEIKENQETQNIDKLEKEILG